MTIETLGEIRAKYNFWNEQERPYYEALSEAIRVLNAQKDKFHYAKIVRCRECKHYDNPQKCIVANIAKHKGEDRFLLFDANWFCADGEREVQE